MRPLHTALVAATLATLPAAAQQSTTPPGTGAGFFAPQPNGDPSLTHTLPPDAYQPVPAPAAPRPPAALPAPSVPAAPATAAATANGAPLVVVVPDPGAAARRTEEQMDRAQEESDRARAATASQPPRINGAFTGLTDERDR